MFTDEPKEEYVQDGLHETKIISFLGRTTPIILQNDNGPCPLLAICNVLLLRNSLNVSSGTSEASQEKLLSLVAERLIDANSNISDKDTAYVQNQQQNIADAIDLLPRLATGIDVNIKFKRIDDFEFTRECAIFDLFDIPLYHGWIVDPQDYSTADAIGSKSYNALTGELVALEAQSVKDGRKNGPEEDCVDFVAARTATLGVPSPCLPRGSSFDGDAGKGEMEGKGGVLEAVMKVSELEISSGLSRVMETSASAVDEERGICVACEGASTVCDGHEIVEGASTVCDGHEAVEGASTACDGHGAVVVVSDSRVSSEEDDSRDGNGSKIRTSGGGGPGIRDDHFCADGLTEDLSGERSTVDGGMNDKDSCTVAGRECEGARTGSSDCRTQNAEGSEDGGEPGEECAVHSTTVLSGGDAGLPDASSSGITSQQGELVKSFLKNNASQLTVYGLFCLQDGLKERELCVFFRNNHFSTMFKFEGELYLLVTDLGYLNQANVVWEKLNEVNGDTLFVTGNFQEFRLEAATWDRHAALSGEYISSVNASQEEGGSASSTTSDLQLAMALQQQEFEQKDPPPKMAVGPAGGQIGAGRAKGASLPARHEGKFRDKCVLM